MKFRVFVALASLVLSAAILLLLPAASSTPPNPTAPSGQLPGPPDRTTAAPVPGVVRVYSCDPEQLAVLDTLAAQYADLTGAQVVVLGAQEDGCEASLSRLMAGEETPAMLCVHSQAQLQTWQESLFDLRGTALAAELVNSNFGLYAEDKLLGIAVDLQAFGLLMNAELLATKAALSRDDLVSLSALTTAAQILKSNSTKAFPCTTLDTDDLLQLACTDNTADLQKFLCLYNANSLTAGTPIDQFLDGKCVFYLGSSRDFVFLNDEAERVLQARNVDILPTYTAGALQYTFSSVWCVNGNVSQEDLDATLQFMTWMVTAGEDGIAPVDSLQMLTPFRAAGWYGTSLEKKLLSYMRKEPALVQWTLQGKQYSALAMALQQYVIKPSFEDWNNVIAYLAQLKV